MTGIQVVQIEVRRPVTVCIGDSYFPTRGYASYHVRATPSNVAPSPPDSSAFLSPDFDFPRRACLNHQLRDGGPDGLCDSMRVSWTGSILGVQLTCWCGAGENGSSPTYFGPLCKPMPFLTLWQSLLCLLAVVLLTPSLASRMATYCRESPVTPFDRVDISFFFFCLLVSCARDIVHPRMC
ncbi:hypothetical protein EDB86DRAFT_1777427 [Lactarius hatsudake]|nr:hypothetical protein EDB86DRAFT_1777427 [Lactarius hatsudake]